MKRDYKILEMEAEYKNATTNVLKGIKGQFLGHLSALAVGGLNRTNLNESSHIAVCDLNDHLSLRSIYSMQGFYVICTNYAIANNLCTFSLDNQRAAVYRGECSSVRRRVESHLFNNKYRTLYEQRKQNKLSNGKKFSEPYYGACIKIDPAISGINIDSGPYNNSKWSIIVFKMQGSSSIIRKQAELAFDELFGKPIASRE